MNKTNDDDYDDNNNDHDDTTLLSFLSPVSSVSLFASEFRWQMANAINFHAFRGVMVEEVEEETERGPSPAPAPFFLPFFLLLMPFVKCYAGEWLLVGQRRWPQDTSTSTSPFPSPLPHIDQPLI